MTGSPDYGFVHRRLTPADSCPLLDLPADGATDLLVERQGFQWHAVNGATAYKLYISLNEQPFYLAATVTDIAALVDLVTESASGRWYVNAVVKGVEQDCSGGIRTFTTEAPDLSEVSFVDDVLEFSPGDAGFVAVQRVGSVESAASVDVVFQNGTATNGTEFTAVTPTTVSWAPGEAAPVLVDVDIAAQQLTTVVQYTQTAIPFSDSPRCIWAEGNLIYVGNLQAPLAIYDVSNPAVPSLVSTYMPPGHGGGDNLFAHAILKDGNYLYIGHEGGPQSGGIVVIDVSNPAAPVEVSRIDSVAFVDPEFSFPVSIIKDGNYLYCGCFNDEAMIVVDVTDPTNISLFGHIRDSTATGYRGARGVVKYGDYLYMCLQTRDAIVTFDVSNPAAPVDLGQFFGPTPGTSLDQAYDVVRVGTTLFVACPARDSIAAIDVTVPASPVWIAEYRGPSPGVTFNGVITILLQGDELWAVGETNATTQVIRRVNIDDPANMTLVGSHTLSFPGFGQSAIFDMIVSGNMLWLVTQPADQVIGVRITAGDFTATLENATGNAVIVEPDTATVTIA